MVCYVCGDVVSWVRRHGLAGVYVVFGGSGCVLCRLSAIGKNPYGYSQKGLRL